jgi:hypothetical protein
MSKAFVKDDAPVEDAADALPERPSEPLPITPAGYERLQAEFAGLPKDSRRARVLAQVLETVRITPPTLIAGGAGFGCEVTVEYEDDEEARYVIVGPDEVGPEGTVSVLAPLAKALLGKMAGDDFEIRAPRGARRGTVVAIKAE